MNKIKMTMYAMGSYHEGKKLKESLEEKKNT